jgi:HB1/ASXL restriction endonuclease-like protein with HTH domain
MTATKTKKTTARKAKTTKKATKAALKSIEANLDAIDGAEGKKAKRKAKTSKEPKAKKTSALDAAAQVLAESKEPMNTRQMIEVMAAKKLWTSPGGKTPHATLYSAILREINEKGKDARFTKTERGKFAANGKA